MRLFHTVFENHPKMSHLNFSILAFSTNFVRLKLTCLVTLFDRKLQVFKNSPKWIIFGIFNELLSTQHVNVARFARNIEYDFFCDFQTLCDWFFFLSFYIVFQVQCLLGHSTLFTTSIKNWHANWFSWWSKWVTTLGIFSEP